MLFYRFQCTPVVDVAVVWLGVATRDTQLATGYAHQYVGLIVTFAYLPPLHQANLQ